MSTSTILELQCQLEIMKKENEELRQSNIHLTAAYDELHTTLENIRSKQCEAEVEIVALHVQLTSSKKFCYTAIDAKTLHYI